MKPGANLFRRRFSSTISLPSTTTFRRTTTLLGGLQNLPFFRSHQAELNEADVAALTKLLHTSWSTEYALRATAELGDENFLRNALHWTFPQAYHAILVGPAGLPVHHRRALATTAS